MSVHGETASQAVPPHVQLIQMGTASWVTAVVYAAAKLGLADQLAAGPRNAAELAGPMRLHAPSLHRLMRTLASLGILTERDAQRFALTPLGEALKTGAPGSARATLIAFGGAFWRGWEQIVYSLETGKTGFDKAHGMPLFEYLGQHPAEASDFSEAMVGFHGEEPPAVARGVRLLRIQDRRGRRRRHGQPAGGDPVESCGTARRAVRQAARGGRRAGRCSRPAASTIASRSRRAVSSRPFPPAATATCCRTSSTTGTKGQCLTILGHCRKAIKPDGRLLIVEMVLPAGDTPHPGKVLDMVMLVFPGGQERTEAEYAALLGKAGFRLSRVVPTASAVSVVEAVPA